uniref:Amine oxidase n=1 Tax=Romanomermis culicivorax TaxID=13658 RepID=A0A915HMX9_ROMCU
MWYFRSSKILADQVLHPLDPLDPAEIELASLIVRSEERLKNVQQVKFMSITLIEPRKELCMSNDATREGVDRAAYVVMVNNEECSTWEIEVNLTKKTIQKWSQVLSGQPSVANEEFLQVENAIKSSPLVKAALKKRGIEDIDRLTIDPWPFGRFNLPYEGDGLRRRIMSMCFLKNKKDPNDFFYAHPIEGFSPIIDVNKMEVVHVEDLMDAEGPDAVPPVPDKTFHWRAKPENGLKPIILSQPKGPSFKVKFFINSTPTPHL